ncbi:MAG: MerR family transcriptional regulator [Actinomycetota bacterium]|nr:MerR family transcriptional regulator [Actinomycetota bacterium]
MTGVPVATVKYYLREGLVPPGRATGATQAQYDEHHVARLRLARALVQVGGLSVAAARDVLASLDAGDESLHRVLGAAHSALPPQLAGDDAPTRAREFVTARGWRVHPEAPALRQLEHALQALADVGAPASDDRLAQYADLAYRVAEIDVASVPMTSTEEAATTVVVGTVLWEPVLLALRRLAQEAVSAEVLDHS